MCQIFFNILQYVISWCPPLMTGPGMNTCRARSSMISCTTTRLTKLDPSAYVRTRTKCSSRKKLSLGVAYDCSSDWTWSEMTTMASRKPAFRTAEAAVRTLPKSILRRETTLMSVMTKRISTTSRRFPNALPN